MGRLKDFKLKAFSQSQNHYIILGETLSLVNQGYPLIILVILKIISLRAFIQMMILRTSLKDIKRIQIYPKLNNSKGK